LPAIKSLLFDDIESPAELLVRIAEQLEGQLLLHLELLVRGQAVARHPDDTHPGLAEGGVQAAEILRLARAARRHVFGVEVEDQLLSQRLLQPPGPAARRGEREVRHLRPYLRRGHQTFTIRPFTIRTSRAREWHRDSANRRTP